MLQGYRISSPNEKSKELGEKITALLVSSAVTYKEAEDALECAQDMLMGSTYPSISEIPLPDDSEPKP